MTDQVTVVDNPQAQRYELSLDGKVVGLATYSVSADTMTIPHTEVNPSVGGRGLGGVMVKFALDDARARGLRVEPACPFVGYYIQRHPEYADLL